jgi:hypothetical protein
MADDLEECRTHVVVEILRGKFLLLYASKAIAHFGCKLIVDVGRDRMN